MIQIVAPSRPLQEMLLLELQGKVVIPQKLLEETHDQQQRNVSGVKRSRDAEEPSTAAASHSQASVGRETVLEVPLGHVVGDSRNATRCSLRIGTLIVDGSRGRRREPLLVLKRRDQQEQQQLHVQGSHVCRSSSVLLPPPPPSRCCLLQEWLAEHPEELTLNAVCAAVDPKTVPTKVYDLVGVVERYVHLNSKPLRTLS